MLAVCLLLGLLTCWVESICTGSLYWNPLDNACVQCSPCADLECPWDPPNLYYADSSTNQCVVTCPTTPSLFANDFSQTCDSGTFAASQSVPTTQP